MTVDFGTVSDRKIACYQQAQSALAPKCAKRILEQAGGLKLRSRYLPYHRTHVLRHTGVTIGPLALQVTENKDLWQPDL